jgi:hypothetical protein
MRKELHNNRDSSMNVSFFFRLLLKLANQIRTNRDNNIEGYSAWNKMSLEREGSGQNVRAN